MKNAPRILRRPVFLPGTKNVAILPTLKKLGIIHGMSIGKDSKNMSESLEKENLEGVRARNEAFLQTIGSLSLANGFLLRKGDRGKSPILSVTKKTRERVLQRKLNGTHIETNMNAEALITLEPFPLMARVADCFVVIIYAKTKKGRPLLSLLHLSRNQVDNLLIEKVISRLKGRLFRCKTKDMHAGVFMGMGKKYHTIRISDKEKLIIEKNWKGFMEISDDEQHIHLDSLGNILFQLQKEGIKPSRIEAYGYSDNADTFGLAKKGLAFSHRFAVTNNPKKNGRNLVVAQLV